MNNWERMNREMAYISDETIMEEQKKCRRILQRLNFCDRSDFEKISEILQELLDAKEGAFVNPPFYCDYGKQIHVGKNFYANYNCTILDTAPVTIGDNCQIAPNVGIYTAGHPIHPDTRASAYEYGKAIDIGDNVWIGANTVILPGINIGNNVVIGAGSVVTRDLPDWVIASGNPCKVRRMITDDDRRKLYKDELIDEEAWNEICEKYGWES
ncbi:MAG: sugar O-acetyltransferase [Erysipelotrichaceae bacterium]|nr:sugar O-acetyltransferase [Erysipelotrichaceae bacterium]